MTKEKKKYTYLTKTIRCPDGSRKYIRAKTQKELDEKVKAAECEVAKGVNITDKTTFAEFAQIWVDVYKRPRNTERSMAPVLGRLNNHVMPTLGPLRMRDIKAAHIALVMSRANHLSRAVQSALLSDLRAIFNAAVDNMLIPRSPVPATLKASGEGSKAREPLTPQDCAEMFDLLAKKAPWVTTFAMLCLYAGLRAGEACGLYWDCVDFGEGVIRVRRQYVKEGGKYLLVEHAKTSAGIRDIPMPPLLLSHLRAVRANATSTAVVADQRGPISSTKRCYRRLDSLPTTPHIHPHLLRHTYATRLVEAGMNPKEVQYLLGHSSIEMTMKIYAHYDRKSNRESTAQKVANVSFTL